jgi:hypothetical protein
MEFSFFNGKYLLPGLVYPMDTALRVHRNNMAYVPGKITCTLQWKVNLGNASMYVDIKKLRGLSPRANYTD